MAKGGGNKSGGSAKASAPAAKASAPAAKASAPVVKSSPSSQKAQQKSPQNVQPTFIPTTSSQKQSKQGANTSSGNNTKNRVATLTQKAKDLIKTASGGAIADPAKFKDILGKLKNLDKDKQVQKLRTQKQQAVAATRPKIESGGSNDSSGSGSSTGLTQDDLNAAINNALANYQPGGLTQEDLDAALAGFSSQQTESFGGQEGGGGGGSSWEQGYTDDLNKWLSEYKDEQAGRAADYQSMLTDIASQEGQFDPNLFRSLLGELESSKKRQKEWNERSARQAYKY